MTIPSTPRKAGPLLGNGVTTSFPFSFKVFAPTDVKVVIANSAGVETVLVLNSDYTVTLNANQDTSPGGTITYPISGSPLPSGSVLSIIGNISYDQPLDLPSGGNFSPLALENQLDRTTMQIQQLREEMDRAVKLPPTSSESAEELVADLQRVADSADNLDTVAGSIGNVNTVAANIADVQTVASNVTDITNFADVYQGGKPSDPTLRNDGSALQPGDLYFNTTAGRLRVFDGTVWQEGSAGSITVQRFSGNGSQTAFTLDAAPSDENNTQVYISGVYQQKNTYSVSGTTLTFSSAPPAGADNIEVVVMRVLPLNATDASLTNYLPAGTGAVARTVQDKLREFVSVNDFGAVGDGATDAAPGINAAIAAAYTNGVGTVLVKKGNYVIDSAITMKAGVRLLGEPGARVFQRNGANLATMIDFGYPVTADGAILEGLTIDGNRDNNTDSFSVFTVHVRTASDAQIKNCTFRNSNGYFIATNGIRTSIVGNKFTNCYMAAAFFYHGPLGADAYGRFDENFCSEMGGGAVLFQNSNYCVARRNIVIGTVIGGRGARTTVNTSGTTVTWVSGPNFSAIRPGMWVVLNNGQEYRIASKTSDTVLVVESTMPTLSGVQASVGTGDLMGNISSSFCQVTDNTLYGGAAYGMGGVASGGHQCSFNLWERNVISYSGKHAINLSYDAGAGFCDMNTIANNKIFNPGSAGGISTNDKIGIFIHSGAPGKVINTLVDGNTVLSATGDGQTEYWLGVDGAGSLGSVFVGKNVSSGMANEGIKNDVVSVTLSAAWGSAATATNVVSHGSAVRVTVNCAGSGISFNPSLTVNKICGTRLSPTPLLLSKMITTSGAYFQTFGEQLSGAGSWTCVLNGTPISGQSYAIAIHDAT